MADRNSLSSMNLSAAEPLHGGRGSSPSTPPYSPITPTMSLSLPVKNEHPSTNNTHAPPPVTEPQHTPATQQTPKIQPHPPQQRPPQPPPPSQPISLSDNSDAIALRAAMSILQIQRQQALRDMKTLEAQKQKAMQNPEAFAKDVVSGKIKARGMQGIIPSAEEQDADEHSSDDENIATAQNEIPSHSQESKATESFGLIPSAQNVVRMPPVNWTKYHIVGQSLDKLHEEQRRRPSAGQPLRDEDFRPRERAVESVVAAPYDPWVDGVGEKVGRTRRGGMRKG